ncbi:septum site-determining protein MinC [Bacillus kwashiorkori]|uniref:septum site-determining protein MinC n=1 Tax=Bacillus kwashiorkori TaxID=1522318 RepID=UPI00078622DB|nr:septum site-determining protein MinC [Bacillus kwashiorkori]
MVKSHNVMIKGTKDGLILQLDDTCSFSDLLKELEEKLLFTYKDEDEHQVDVTIQTGNRYLSASQRKLVKKIVSKKKNLNIAGIDANVLLKEEAERLKRETELAVINKVVRSGQVLHFPGDVLIIGDVNPGGTVRAKGNIFILGSLKGTAHAGYEGNEDAVICASIMKPTQLRISQLITRAPDRDDRYRNEVECAYINQEKQIVVDRFQVLNKIRPNLTRFMEGGF